MINVIKSIEESNPTMKISESTPLCCTYQLESWPWFLLWKLWGHFLLISRVFWYMASSQKLYSLMIKNWITRWFLTWSCFVDIFFPRSLIGRLTTIGISDWCLTQTQFSPSGTQWRRFGIISGRLDQRQVNRRERRPHRWSTCLMLTKERRDSKECRIEEW